MTGGYRPWSKFNAHSWSLLNARRHCKEWPDHIGIELEFLHYLTFLEATVPDAMMEDYVAAESDFLDRHLARWVPGFSRKLGEGDVPSPYRAFGEVLAQFIAGDREFIQQRRSIQ